MSENADKDKQFTFAISLSVLNHLGRNLYRSFTTVLGEAISNAWDADAQNVHIYIDREKSNFVIKDDGIGMSADDFQNKFLKIGYTKRKGGNNSSGKGRPYIGRKGIGKLALLSCSDKVSVVSKIAGGNYIGGLIDNSGLDDAIDSDLNPDEYKLETVDSELFGPFTENHEKGTIIYFENIRVGIKHTIEYLRKVIALYFRFSLKDNSFNIFLNDEKITTANLKDLAQKTEYLWKINVYSDPYVEEQLICLKENKSITTPSHFNGFVASVEKPSNLKIFTTEERVSIDLFTNGRLREKDILKYIPSARVVESYLYGQIHYDEMDDEIDRFSSSREGVVANDPKFEKLLEDLKTIINQILEDWDIWRYNHKQEGDSENKRITKRDRKATELYNSVAEEYTPPPNSENKDKIDGWIDDLADDAKYNFGSYAECFISENLIRKYIHGGGITLSPSAKKTIERWRKKEKENKKNGNCNIDIRQNNSDISYLEMADLAFLVDKQQGSQNCLPTDAKEYKPIRDALMHTALLTNEAKTKLTSVYYNIKGRIKTLLSSFN
jgi:hypothetical protein